MTEAQFRESDFFGSGWKNNIKGCALVLLPELRRRVATGPTKTVLER
jgi:hypothetical protein